MEDGDDEISDSIATQLAIGAGIFALNHELIHVKTYIDDGYSGLEFDRPDFQNMMDDLRTGLINCVVVKDVSRVGRNYKNLGTFFSETIRDVIEPLKAELVVIRKQVLDTRAQASKAQDAFAENFENYMDGKLSKEQFSENAIPIRENMKRLEAEESDFRHVMDAMDAKMDSIVALKQLLRDFLKSKDLSKEVVEITVNRILIGVEHVFTVEYKLDFRE